MAVRNLLETKIWRPYWAIYIYKIHIAHRDPPTGRFPYPLTQQTKLEKSCMIHLLEKLGRFSAPPLNSALPIRHVDSFNSTICIIGNKGEGRAVYFPRRRNENETRAPRGLRSPAKFNKPYNRYEQFGEIVKSSQRSLVPPSFLANSSRETVPIRHPDGYYYFANNKFKRLEFCGGKDFASRN